MAPPLFQLLSGSPLPPGVDAGRLARTAAAHGLSGVVLAEARRSGLSFSAGDATALASEARAVAAQALRTGALLGRVLDAFSARGLSPVILKGPPLAERCWPEPLLRPAVDVDVLVRPGDLDAAGEALAGLGLERAAEGDGDHHLVWQGQAGMVELHHQLLSGLGATLGWTNLQPPVEGRWQGRPVRLLSPGDELLYLCVHAANHLFRRTSWLYDVKLLLERTGPPDWGQVGELARKSGFVTPLWAGLDAAARCFHAPVPAEVLAELAPPLPLRAALLRAFSLERLESSAWAESRLRAGALRAAMSASPRNAARYAWGRALRSVG